MTDIEELLASPYTDHEPNDVDEYLPENVMFAVGQTMGVTGDITTAVVVTVKNAQPESIIISPNVFPPSMSQTEVDNMYVFRGDMNNAREIMVRYGFEENPNILADFADHVQ